MIANIPVQAESLLHSLEQVVRGISLNEDASKREFMNFKQEETNYTLSSKPLKSVDQFTDLGSNILSTESDVNIHLGKGWTTINR